MNKYGNRNGIRYTKKNHILHIVFGRYHIKVCLSDKEIIVENAKTGCANWF